MGLKENQMVIGHTITNDYSSEGAYIGEAGTYPIGASLSATELAPYAGCQIIGMRIASTLNQASTRIFIYDCSDLNTAVHEQKTASIQVGPTSFSTATELKSKEMKNSFSAMITLRLPKSQPVKSAPSESPALRHPEDSTF